ncbi:LPXTG cell wall anchor domain-containing protein [Solibaculum mannosilyticum]|uniref:Gram-positive cocci surface proteins LPxTG domain-containing protein n=1 Tax=Solibaculum mannosilyticum TaxID=2780922 RepID=A0A7I8CZ68_9FIRM|nr:LPXTG cell wall anchor domain-containing protein [Solibaculum mannosilyticum]BCI59781.1 hypothetical protein C12CBH8_04200 [Solibaculum mannosilyticum]
MKNWKTFVSAMCAVLLVAGTTPVSTVSAAGSETCPNSASALDSQSVNRASNELVIDDNSFNLDSLIKSGLGDSPTIKIGVDLTGVGQTVLPKQVTLLTGWKTGNFFEPEEYETERQLGNNIQGAAFTFEEGSNVTVKSIRFKMPEKSITIPAGVTVNFENCSFNSTIVNYGNATFHNCTFGNGQIENHGNASYTGTTSEPENTVEPQQPIGGELIIDDSNPYDLDEILASSLGSNNVVKIAYNMSSVGNTVLPSQVKTLMGWQIGNIFYDEGEKVRTLGNNLNDETFSFEAGSNTTVRSIDFRMKEKAFTIPEGATVQFVNCSFSDTIVNNGTAVFDNCTFKNGKIENNGAAEYINGTKEPENLGTPSEAHIPLGVVIHKSDVQDAVVGTQYAGEISYEVSGSNKDQADVTVEVSPSDMGIRAEVKEGKIVLSGTPTKAGTVDVTLTAKAQGDTDVSDTVQVSVNQPLTVSVEGQLDCVTAGQSGYSDYLDVYVAEGDGEKVNYYDYMQGNSDAELEVSLSPEGSGMTASWLFDQISVSGTPEKAGTYYVSVTLKDKGQVVTSNQVELRIYTGDETLKGQFETLDGSQSTWDMEPYEIWNSDNAVVPTYLKTIYGSHESGLYGIIGNNKSIGTDTLVIPDGCDVTLENIKVYSSVKIIVEKGGSLTLRDSVAYGTIEVNGGTFSMDHSAGLVDQLILNDGSVLKDADIVSNGRFLTDGSGKEVVDTVVIVNGTVTAQGINTIEAECGHGDEPGQTALQVNGQLVIPEGSVLTAIGGGDELYGPGWNGGIGVYLNNGVISGEGKLIAKGGVGVDGPGGNAIDGTGKITVAELESTGGDSIKLIVGQDKGGDAVGESVIVTTKNPVLKGGDGDPVGSAVVTLKSDKSVLKDLLSQLKELNEADYTAESWTVLQEAIADAQAVLDDNDATQDQVDQAVSDLEAAQKQLEKKQEPSQEPDDQDPEQPGENEGSQTPGQNTGDDSSQGSTQGGSTSNPSTGESSPVAGMAGLLAASGLTLAILKKKKSQ